MEIKRFKQIDLWLGVVVCMVAAYTYLSTIEPTASFWDCGEFIASSYKLEVGHPPGNPTFQIIARFFTLFGGKEQAAILVNAMSALCSAATILFLFWSITHLGRRLLERNKETFTLGNTLAVMGAGTVGALAYTFSDTFWFSAVEAEVYAMSSLFTAAVVWAMLKWEEVADKPYSNRWIVLIAYLMGLSIGVHLLNLLAIPALVFIYYYKKYTFSWKGAVKAFTAGVVILAVALWGVIPGVPKVAFWFDLLFVNVFGFGFNTGTAFFVVLLFALSFWGIYATYKKGKVLWNTILLCFTVMMIGYSSFAMIIIRSSANTPTNENQPDNPYALLRYLNRDQYGSQPLLYGETFASTYSVEVPLVYTKMDNKYKQVPGSLKTVYKSETKTFFPRMWSSGIDSHIRFYEGYTGGKGKVVPGQTRKMPYFSDNLKFFWDYQINHMYFRYFMWNFAGRQNDFHSTTPGDPYRGNWESGIGAIDKWRLGDQSQGPDYIVNNNAKNHFYFLPLILGLIGLFYQHSRDRRNLWIVFLLFFLTGLAIVLYLNQTPLQARERDYAYAGSFYAFAIWIGIGVMAIYDLLKKSKMNQVVCACVAGGVCLIVPIQMGSQTWDDHDRSHRYTARDMAYNYLMTCDPQGILVTIGDNDTFPLWYAQEVEGVRTDVRILNTSLLGTDWYIDQMKYRLYESLPLPFTVPRELYVGGTNDGVEIYEKVDRPITLKAAMGVVSNPNARLKVPSGEMYSYLPARRLLIPVNKENVEKYGIVNPKHFDRVLDTIELSLSPGKRYITKTEMMILSMLSNYQWDRPIYFTGKGGDLGLDLERYLQYEGFSYKLVPILSEPSRVEKSPQVDTDKMYDLIMKVYRWDSFSDPRMHVDYQNQVTFQAILPIRSVFAQTAVALVEEGQMEKAVEVLDKMQEAIPASLFPYSTTLISPVGSLAVLDAIDSYAAAGAPEKAVQLSDAFVDEVIKALYFFSKPDMYSDSDVQANLYLLFHVMEIVKAFDKEKSDQYDKRMRAWADELDLY
ncbi:MAG: DUF2723 domain-containing protein [Prevotellaceae bacterium]|jgi:hypothetical protein|nr:DUF2723 domain-containing protein [Prevotellaceae bacterium]